LFIGHHVTEGAKLYRLSSTGERSLWDAYVHAHPDGTVFHLSPWQRFIEASFNHRPLHLACENQPGAIAGVLPLFLVRSRIFGRMLVSTPQAAYGGILADSPSVAHSLLEKAKEIAREQRVQFLEIRNFRRPLEDPGLMTKDLYVTFRQDLSEDPEKNFLSIPRKTRAECREGIKNGLEFKVDEIGVDGFYQVYARSVRTSARRFFQRACSPTDCANSGTSAGSSPCTPRASRFRPCGH